MCRVGLQRKQKKIKSKKQLCRGRSVRVQTESINKRPLVGELGGPTGSEVHKTYQNQNGQHGTGGDMLRGASSSLIATKGKYMKKRREHSDIPVMRHNVLFIISIVLVVLEEEALLVGYLVPSQPAEKFSSASTKTTTISGLQFNSHL